VNDCIASLLLADFLDAKRRILVVIEMREHFWCLSCRNQRG
jgi:hypothetical protein